MTAHVKLYSLIALYVLAYCGLFSIAADNHWPAFVGIVIPIPIVIALGFGATRDTAP